MGDPSGVLKAEDVYSRERVEGQMAADHSGIRLDLECCIFPQNAANPFVIDGATVRWINAREFGLSFTSVRPGVQRQIAQLCRTQAA